MRASYAAVCRKASTASAARSPSPTLPSPTIAPRTVVVAGRRGHDGHAGVVLGGGPDQRRAADVDLLDQLVEGDPGPLGGGRERVQVDDDELERRDRRLRAALAVGGLARIGQDPAVDPRVERLDPAVEHLGEAGHGGDVGHRQTGLAQRPCRAAGRHQLEAASPTSPAANAASPVLSDTDRSARRGRGTGRVRDGRIEPHGSAVRLDRQRPGQQQRHGPRQQPVLDGPDPRVERRRVVAGQHADRFLGDDRPAVERRVDEMDRAAGDRHPVRQGVVARRARPGTPAAATGAC